jgi:hypothetical protein
MKEETKVGEQKRKKCFGKSHCGNATRAKCPQSVMCAGEYALRVASQKDLEEYLGKSLADKIMALRGKVPYLINEVFKEYEEPEEKKKN